MSIRRVVLWHQTYPFGLRPTLTHGSPWLASWMLAASNDDGGLVDWHKAVSNRRETMPRALNIARAPAGHLRTLKIAAEIGSKGRFRTASSEIWNVANAGCKAKLPDPRILGASGGGTFTGERPTVRTHKCH